jgi:hypothetical protein
MCNPAVLWRVKFPTTAVVKSATFCSIPLRLFVTTDQARPQQRQGANSLEVQKLAMSSTEKIVLRDYPIWIWFVAALVLAGAGLTAISGENGWGLIVMSLIGFLFIAFASILTVTVDYDQGNLNLHYRSLFRLSTKVFPLREVCLVEVVEDDERERMYRMELILQSGEVIPLRYFYSVGKRRKKRRAERILTAIQVGSGQLANGRRSAAPQIN